MPPAFVIYFLLETLTRGRIESFVIPYLVPGIDSLCQTQCCAGIESFSYSLLAAALASL